MITLHNPEASKGVDGGAWEEIRVGRKQIIGVSKWS